MRLRFLLYSTDLAPEKPTVKYYPPYKYVEATIGVNPEVVVTRIRKPEEHTQPLGETPPPGIRDLSFEEVGVLRDEFHLVIEKMLPFIGKRELVRQEADNVRRYRKLFALLVEPELQKEYHKISPEFFQWLDKVQP